MKRMFVSLLAVSVLSIPAFAEESKPEAPPPAAAPAPEQPKEYTIKSEALMNILNSLDALQGPKHSQVMQLIQYIQQNVTPVEAPKKKEAAKGKE